jgi:hypothetical protein
MNRLLCTPGTIAADINNPALVGNQSRRIEHRGSCERQYDWARSKKNELKPHLVQQWVIPPQASSAFVPDKRILIHQVAAWEADRNTHHAKADWHFTTDDARIKLKHTDFLETMNPLGRLAVVRMARLTRRQDTKLTSGGLALMLLNGFPSNKIADDGPQSAVIHEWHQHRDHDTFYR